MFKQIALAIALAAVSAAPSLADNVYNSSGARGTGGNTSNLTGQGSQSMGGVSTWITGPQTAVWQKTGFGQLAGAPQPTVLDSFVAQSGYNDMIYGDESIDSAPPYDDFLPIGAGMGGMGGLTTGNQDMNLPTGSGDVYNPATGTYTDPTPTTPNIDPTDPSAFPTPNTTPTTTQPTTKDSGF